MDLLKDEPKKLYFNYLWAAIGSALILSIYSIVDFIMVGKYQGPSGTAALSIFSPIWNIIISLGVLFGIGGAVLLAKARGEKNYHLGNKIFTISLIWSFIVFTTVSILIGIFSEELFIFFGADTQLLPLSESYLKWIIYVLPLYALGQVLGAFIRNDNSPKLVTLAFVLGGLFNIFGDYYFVFTCDMGIEGAGLATAIGQVIVIGVLLIHFFMKKNTLKLIKFDKFWLNSKKIYVTGFSTFVIDIALALLTIIYNNQIMKHLGINYLAVFGVVDILLMLIQFLAYGFGQAAQPIISTNFGAKREKRIISTAKYGFLSSFIFGVVMFLILEIFPSQILNIFINITDDIAVNGPIIIRLYAITFLILPINVFSTYYFQAIMRPRISLFISLLRGIFLSGAMIYIIPIFLKDNYIFLAMPFTEMIVVVIVIILVIKLKVKFENDKPKINSI